MCCQRSRMRGAESRPHQGAALLFSAVRGFTLIEIAVVMAIIGMVMLLVIPRLPSSEQENLKTSAQTLAATLRYAQERAATTRNGFFVTLSPGTDSVKISETGGEGSAREPADPLLQRSVLKDGVMIADVRIPRLGKMSDGQIRLEVGAGGIRDFVTIHLRSSDSRNWTVMVFPAGGKVKAFEGYLEEPP